MMNLNCYILIMMAILSIGKTERVKTKDAARSGMEKYQTPQAYVPPDPVIYPDNYCEHFSDDDEFDYVVVGSGPGGATVARRLAEDPEVKVLILEAGGDPPPNSDIPSQAGDVGDERKWHFHSVDSEELCTGREGPGCSYTTAKILGGSSVINGMKYVRGNKKDYNDWEKIGCKGWSYKDVLPYFKKSEKYSNLPMGDKEYHGSEGPLHHSAFPKDPSTFAFREALIQAQKQIGIKHNPDFNGANQMGVSDSGGMLDPLGYRNSVVRAFLLHVPDNLKVCKNSLAMKIDLVGKKAVGIDFRYNGTGEVKHFKARAKREYIISAGSLNSAPLLERSGIGRSDVLKKVGIELKHELPGVGENFQDHLGTGQLFKVRFQSTAASNPLSTSLLSLATFFNTSDPKSSVPDVQISYILTSPSPELKINIAEGQSLLYVQAVHIRHPIPGSLHITQAEDPTISPEIITNHLKTSFEKQRITKAAKTVRKFMSSDVLKPFQVEPVVIQPCQQHKFNSEDEVMCQMRSLSRSFYHVVGTTAMGDRNNPKAVVDPELRVIGIENLRIVDSGIMPLVTRGNTEIPTVMIGEKAADMIKNAWK